MKQTLSHKSLKLNAMAEVEEDMGTSCVWCVGVKLDRIWMDNPYTVSYFIFILGFGSGMDMDSDIGLCGFEYQIRRIRMWYGNRTESNWKWSFTIFIYEEYINYLN